LASVKFDADDEDGLISDDGSIDGNDDVYLLVMFSYLALINY